MKEVPLSIAVAINRALVEQPLFADDVEPATEPARASAFSDVVQKAARGYAVPGSKYVRRWRGKGGKWEYGYGDEGKGKGKAEQLDLFGMTVQEVLDAPPSEFGSTVQYDPSKPWTDPSWTPELESYDTILVNSSAGKDSQAMLDRVVRLCDERGISRDKILVVHADLGKVEWDGTRELAEEQAKHYGLRFEVVEREQGDLLEQVRDRYDRMQQREKDVALLAEQGVSTFGELVALGKERLAEMLPEPDTHRSFAPMQRAVQLLKSARKKDPDAPVDFGASVPWPSSQARYCTSDQKTSQINKLIKRLGSDRVLSCLGIRAQESPARAKKAGFGTNNAASNQTRHVDYWYPIFGWTEEQVWHTIEESGVPHHFAYDKGMSRLSCAFCVFASKEDLAIAAENNPELFKEYLRLEQEVGATFQPHSSLADTVAAVQARRREQHYGDKVPLSALSLSKGGDIDVGPLLEALHVVMAMHPPRAITVDWKDGGACLHVDTGDDSVHVAYMQGPHARAGSVFAAAAAEAHGLPFEQHGTPPPVD